MTKPRRLKGHNDAVTCCVASRATPGTIFSSGEDGCVCYFDLRCKDAVFTMEVGKVPVSSICFKAGGRHLSEKLPSAFFFFFFRKRGYRGRELMCRMFESLNRSSNLASRKTHSAEFSGLSARNEDVIYASLGTEIKGFDVHMASSWKPLESYNYNKEEINQIAFSAKSSFLAAADDSGDVKIIDTRQQCLYKTLRAAHTSICSSVQFLPWKPWEVITGGLDSKLVMWDFSRGRPYKVVDFGMPDMDNCESSSNANQCFNPAFVHALAVPEADMLDGVAKICGVGRGDGIVDVIDIEYELAVAKSRSSSQLKKGSQPRSRDSTVQGANAATLDPNQGKCLHLDYAVGGHTAAVSCVAFSLFGERGKFIISGGNDAFVKVWDWSKYSDNRGSSCSSDLLPLSIDVRKKVNWLCTTTADSENLVVCDTSKVMKVYNVS